MFIFEPDPKLILQLETEDTNVIVFPAPPRPNDLGPICETEAEPEGAA